MMKAGSVKLVSRQEKVTVQRKESPMAVKPRNGVVMNDPDDNNDEFNDASC